MNNEPVAWRTHYPSGWEYKDGNPPFELKGNSQLLYINPVNPYKVITDTKIEPTVVSYTHPVELTDEEIIKTMVQFDVYSADDQCLIEAGRAILRKAQEVNLI